MDTAPLAGWENFYVIVGSSAGAADRDHFCFDP